MAKSQSPVDHALQSALRKAYSERARLFVRAVKERGIQPLIQELDSFSQTLDWPKASLGITESAFQKVRRAGVVPHLVFCHPSVLDSNPKALDYYRNLAALSRKGLAQVASGLARDARRPAKVAFINEVICSIIDEMNPFDLAIARAVIPAEIGAEIQGTWVNMIGAGAAKRVREMITEYAEANNVLKSVKKVKLRKRSQTVLTLVNDWTIAFGDEPDVEIRDARGRLAVAIEIKGSMDKAGAQTRYGEAKKSFAKALRENAQCDTIYLASCFTDAVMAQIHDDEQVRRVFNLIDILADEPKKTLFLAELFKHQIRIL